MKAIGYWWDAGPGELFDPMKLLDAALRGICTQRLAWLRITAKTSMGGERLYELHYRERGINLHILVER